MAKNDITSLFKMLKMEFKFEQRKCTPILESLFQ